MKRDLWACGGHYFVEQSIKYFASVSVRQSCHMDPEPNFSENFLKTFWNLSFFPSVHLSFIHHNSDEVW
jgi:hypothetical protein